VQENKGDAFSRSTGDREGGGATRLSTCRWGITVPGEETRRRKKKDPLTDGTKGFSECCREKKWRGERREKFLVNWSFGGRPAEGDLGKGIRDCKSQILWVEIITIRLAGGGREDRGRECGAIALIGQKGRRGLYFLFAKDIRKFSAPNKKWNWKLGSPGSWDSLDKVAILCDGGRGGI